MEFSPDGNTVLIVHYGVGARGGEISSSLGLVDLRKRKWSTVKFERDITHRIESARFFPDGKTIVSCGREPYIRFWNVATGKHVRPIKTKSDRVYAVSFSGDGKKMLTAGSAGLVLWDTAKGTEIRRFTEKPMFAAALCRDGKLAITDDEHIEWKLNLWDTATGKRIREFMPEIVSKKFSVWQRDKVVFLPDEGRIAYLGRQIRIWNVTKPRSLKIIRTQNCQAASFTPTGRYLLTAGTKKQPFRLWEVATGGEALTLPRQSCGPNESVAVSPNGRHALTADDDTVLLWDLRRGSVIAVICSKRGNYAR